MSNLGSYTLVNTKMVKPPQSQLCFITILIAVLSLVVWQAAPRDAVSLLGGQAFASDQCHVFHNRGIWIGNYTSWQLQDGERRDALSKLHDFIGISTRHHPRPRHILLAGDSTMKRLSQNLPIKEMHGQQPTTVKTGKRCGLLEYYSLPRATVWTAPNKTLEGPVVFGLKGFCTDCAGCDAALLSVVDVATNGTWTYEYVPVEFARDREFPTATGATTSQEALGQYLEGTYQRDLCILSAVLHDAKLNITAEQFADNVVNYVNTVRPFCSKIIWLLPSASLNLNNQPQTHNRLLEFGRALETKCSQLGSNLLLLHVWNMSLPKELHADNVHHKPSYYSWLAKILLQPLLFSKEYGSRD